MKYNILYMIIICILTGVFGIYLYKLFYQNNKAIQLYNKAKRESEKQNKKLMVLGSPNSVSGRFIQLFTQTYGCGDICIDMNGCKGCKNSVAAKVEDVLHKYEENSCIIFESGLLEVVDKDKLVYIIEQIYRIAGKKENIYARHYIQKNKPYYKYFIKYIYGLIGEGSINRFVDKYPPNNDYMFDYNI